MQTFDELFSQSRLRKKTLDYVKNFGDWEVVPFTKLPDLDTKYSIEITNLKPSNGEGYLAMCV